MREPGVRAYIRPVVDSLASASARAEAGSEADPKVQAGYQRCAAMYDARRAHAASVLGPGWVPVAESTAVADTR